ARGSCLLHDEIIGRPGAAEGELIAQRGELLRLRANGGLERLHFGAPEKERAVEENALADLARRRRASARIVGFGGQIFEELRRAIACVLQQLACRVLLLLLA